MRTLTRRTLLGLGGIAALGAMTNSAGALTGLLARSQSGVARAIDTNSDGNTGVELQRHGDRGVLATSDGTETPDYAVSLVTLKNEQLTLSDLTGGEAKFHYEFMEGDTNTSAAPDEVWLVLRSKKDGQRGRHAVLRTEDFGGDDWTTRNVSTELTGGVNNGGIDQEWKEFSTDERSLTKVGRNLVDRFGGDANVIAAGIGRGTPKTGSSKIETYYRNFTVDGEVRTLPITAKK